MVVQEPFLILSNVGTFALIEGNAHAANQQCEHCRSGLWLRLAARRRGGSLVNHLAFSEWVVASCIHVNTSWEEFLTVSIQSSDWAV